MKKERARRREGAYSAFGHEARLHLRELLRPYRLRHADVSPHNCISRQKISSGAATDP